MPKKKKKKGMRGYALSVLLLSTSMIMAADNVDTTKKFIDGLEIATFGLVETREFDQTDARGGVGIGATYFMFDNLGFKAETFHYDNHGTFVDRVNLNLVFNAPIGKNVNLRPFGGIGRNIEQDIYGFQVGLNPQVRVWENLFLDVSGRWQKDEDVDSKAVFTAGLSWKF
jgi:hypothetical protein